MAHFLTNRGKLLLMQGLWDDAGASAVRIGLLAGSAVPAAIDTAAEVADVNTVAELEALTGVDEVTNSGYARQNLSRTNAAEDDTNDRVNMDAADVTFTAVVATPATHSYGGFWYDATTDTNDTTRLVCGVFTFASALAFNGSNVTLTITDLVRAA